MSFHGLFIGIDRYASPAINWLNCAKRDAIALEELFQDTLGGASRLLTDVGATRAAIEAEFASLAQVSKDDTVVVAFSGHGSETHELITYDSLPGKLQTTAIPLDELTDWFSRIPARHLVLLLDCCFSGGAGSKVLRVENTSRQIKSAEAQLAAMSGAGRIIVTASAANEPAWENQKVGHGYFTHFLIEAMCGATEVIKNDRIPVYQLLQHVTGRVADAARQFGHAQSPALRGTLDGDVSWPVFVRGHKYTATFPERVLVRTDGTLDSLEQHGLPNALISSWRKSLPGLNKLQISAVNDYGVLDGNHLVVVAPTSSGKTMVGELPALQAVAGRRRAAFLFPLKALVADKLRHFERSYSDFGLRVVAATGETDDVSPIVRGQYDIGLFTYEKFASMVLLNPHILEQVAVVVVDEAQMLADPGRGANLEFLLTFILMRRRAGIEPQLIALSGVVGDTNGLERWIGGRLLRHDERPVPLDEGLITSRGDVRFISAETKRDEAAPAFITPYVSGKSSSQDIIIPLVRKLVASGQQVIVFREQVGETRGCGRYLARSLGLPPAKEAIERLPAGDLSKASVELRETLAAGVAFHNSHLSPDERRIVEEEFRALEAGIRVIVATTTLAMGVNTPASSVVIAGLEHPGGIIPTPSPNTKTSWDVRGGSASRSGARRT
jgi:helicase